MQAYAVFFQISEQRIEAWQQRSCESLSIYLGSQGLKMQIPLIVSLNDFLMNQLPDSVTEALGQIKLTTYISTTKSMIIATYLRSNMHSLENKFFKCRHNIM